MANDNLNLHDVFLHVIRKDGHYDIIYDNNYADKHNLAELKDCDQDFLSIYKNI